MARNATSDDGFSLVEVIVSMLLVGIIAIALIPPLWQGLQFSAQQSAVATATRQLNAMVEEARASPSCGAERDGEPILPNPSALPATFTDGRGSTLTVTAQEGYTCVNEALVRMELTARTAEEKVVATSVAEIFTAGP